METDRIIGENIKSLREKNNFTQEVFANYLGIKREEVSYYENGTRSIPSAVISKIVNLFGLDEYDLYEDDNALSKVNVALAFRVDNIEAEDLEIIAKFKKVVMNYLKMKRALNDGIK